MADPNRRLHVHGHEVVVTLVTGKPEVFVAIQPPHGKIGGLHLMRHVSI